MSVRLTTSPAVSLARATPTITASFASVTTVSLWVKLSSLAAANTILRINDSVSGQPGLIIRTAAGGSTYIFESIDSAGIVQQVTRPATTGVWEHLYVRCNFNSIAAYSTGAGASSTVSTPTLGSRGNWGQLQLGPCDADIQDVYAFVGNTVSNAALAQLEVQRKLSTFDNLFNVRVHWPLYPGSDRGVDYSSYNNHLTASGTPGDGDTSPLGFGLGAPRAILIDPRFTFTPSIQSNTACTGSLSVRRVFSSTTTSPTASVGTLVVRKVFNSNACLSPSSCTGTLIVRKVFNSNPCTSTTACTGTLSSRTIFPTNSCLSPTACTGGLVARKVFNSNACLSPTACTGTMTVIGATAFNGVAASPTACTIGALVRRPVTGTVASPSSCTGTLRVRVNLSGAVASPSAFTGTLRVRQLVTMIVTTPTACTGSQTGGTVVVPAFPEDARKSQKRRAYAISGQFHRRGRM